MTLTWIIFIVIIAIGIILRVVTTNKKRTTTRPAPKKQGQDNATPNPQSPAPKKSRDYGKILRNVLWTLLLLFLVILAIGAIVWLFQKITEPKPKAQTEIIHREIFMRTIFVNYNTNEWRYYSLESIISEAEIRGYDEKEIYFSFNDATNSYCVLNKNNNLACGEKNEDVSDKLPWDVKANRHLRFRSNDGIGTLIIKVYTK